MTTVTEFLQQETQRINGELDRIHNELRDWVPDQGDRTEERPVIGIQNRRLDIISGLMDKADDPKKALDAIHLLLMQARHNHQRVVQQGGGPTDAGLGMEWQMSATEVDYLADLERRLKEALYTR